jgi:hypothetical protein
LTRACDASAARVSTSQQIDIGSLDVDCPGQCINSGHCCHSRVPAAKVQRCSRRRSDWYAVDCLDLVAVDLVTMRLDPSRTTPIVVNQIHDRQVVDPLAAAKRGRGEAGDDTSSTAPEPTRFGANNRIDFGVAYDVHVREQAAIPCSQLTSRQRRTGDGLATRNGSAIAAGCHEADLPSLQACTIGHAD